MHLLHIETTGNQRFIFATNKLRENVGASELIWRIGRFAREVAARPGCRVIIATSGKATVLVPDRETAEAIVREVTRRALIEAPGLEVHGAITSFDPAERLDDAIARVRREHESLRGSIPSPESRFPRLPCVAECSTSGLPAAMPRRGFHGVPDASGGTDLRSAVSQAKWLAAEDGMGRLADAAGDVPVMRSLQELDALERDEVDWLAVIHADGNGLGQLLMGFGSIVERSSPGAAWTTHADLLHEFSQALDTCTRNAFATACREAWHRWPGGAGRRPLPLVPLVLGGDDLTLVCHGRFAVPFARDFLAAFERETAMGLVGEISGMRPGATGPGITACAGVAIVKPHYPFHAAYELAEELLVSAKQVKRSMAERPCSALDFHVLYDSSTASLERIREALVIDGGTTNLTARPYVVSPGFDDHPWAGPRTVACLGERVGALGGRGEHGRRRLPNSTIHHLRESLFLGCEAAEAQLRLVLGRIDAGEFGGLLADGRLFHHDAGSDRHVAFLLDALELDGFWLDSAGEATDG